ncbi:hypothetical protein HZB01_05675 [Candidatus Woesearchaeota archaeon]|nr:hypothetical protein [Candidatus Woesearchaeota archaeon]
MPKTVKPPFNPEPYYIKENIGKQEMIGIVCADYVVRATQTFFFRDLYRMMYHWLIEHEYTDMEGSKWASARPEILYFERQTEKHGTEHYIWWRWKKSIEYNHYFRRLLRINFQTRKMKKTEQLSHGKKLKTEEGEIWIYVTSILELDFNREWRNHWLMKHFHEWYWKKLFWKQFDRHRVRTYREAYEFEHAIKEYFEMVQYHKDKAPWRPPWGKQDPELASP